jgi:hypothetical protein
MAEGSKVEKFSISELANLRNELQEYRSDSWQAADVVSAFLVGRGYGVNTARMRQAVSTMEAFSGSANAVQAMNAMQAALEAVAYVM